MFSSKPSIKGISLIEVLIALLLGILVISAATRSLSSMSASSRLQISHNNMQQTADTALSYISHRLRNAVSMPCGQLNTFNRNNKLNISKLSGTVTLRTKKHKETITSHEEAIIRQLLAGHGIQVRTSTRKLAGKRYKTDNLIFINALQRVFIDGETGLSNPAIRLSNALPNHFTGNKTLFAITNCESMEIFRGRASKDNKRIELWNSQDIMFRENYRSIDSSMLSRLDVSEIKISNSGNLLDKPLFKNSGGSLMSDIELLRIIFSVDAYGNDGIADSYIPAKQLHNLSAEQRIISAELFLIVKDSSTSSSAVPARYTLTIPKTDITSTNLQGEIYADNNTDTLIFTDKIMRKLFIHSITFRNNIASIEQR